MLLKPLTAALCMCVGALVFSCSSLTPTDAGSGTETGNVRGVVVSAGKTPVQGARVSLFKKRSSISSPEESSVPVDETICDEDGKFSFDAQNGNYTIVASSDSKFSFLDDILPGTEDAKNLEAVLKKPGGLQGIIENTIELRGTGSVIVHVLGTDIFQNVTSEGVFSISDIPAGKYRIVSYTTYQPEFSPLYDTVTIYPDSITDLGMYQLPYHGIPIPKKINLDYDTASGVVQVSWNAVQNYEDFQEYVILRGVSGNPLHDLQQIGYTHDTMFLDTLDFTDVDEAMNMEYAVKVRDKLGNDGDYYGIYSVGTIFYQAALPWVDTLTAKFDTAGGYVRLQWEGLDTSEMFDEFGGYKLYRLISDLPYNPPYTVSDSVSLGIVTETHYVDTIYPRLFDFRNDTTKHIRYLVCVYHEEWDRVGKTTSSQELTSPRYELLVPRVEVNMSFDPVQGVATVNWEHTDDSAAISEYRVIRNVTNYMADISATDTFLVESTGLKDTIYPNIISFDETAATTLQYMVQPIHDRWDIAGIATVEGLYDLRSYKFYKPTVSAGENKEVDATAEVTLAGTVISNTFPISKMEWRIGDSDEWVETDDGSYTFTFDGGYEREFITCQFKVTDSLGNNSIDTCRVLKSLLQVSFSLPGRANQGSGTANLPLAKHRGRYYYVGEIDYNKLAVWSSENLNSWSAENQTPGFEGGDDGYSLLSTEDQLLLINPRDKIAYSSADGKQWQEDTFLTEDTLNAYKTGVFKVGEAMYYNTYSNTTPRNHLYESQNGNDWSLKTGVPKPVNQTYENRVSSVFSLDEQVCVHYGYRALKLTEGGSWEQVALWDENNVSFPDDIRSIRSDDSVIVAIYTERPSQTIKATVYRNGTWYSLPLYNLYYDSNVLGLVGGYLIFATSDWDPTYYRIRLY